ncbi:hypothetical protein HMPREF9343_00119 [Cutibacterium acnes HL099PA1]|nr:hypothetical protein HMPREF9616_00036 [Cutibacterium acnes HL007PA1]EGE95359.1 hypothetical protein HMPREF9570_00269 [Cutibacterium acnes HL043PA1]EGF75703.1 hypothetical protein HMPREF9343_00119 [Cutibacterium acnes HL099PA1]
MKKDTGRPAVLRIQHIATAIATWRSHPISLTTWPHRRIEPFRNPTPPLPAAFHRR